MEEWEIKELAWWITRSLHEQGLIQHPTSRVQEVIYQKLKEELS